MSTEPRFLLLDEPFSQLDSPTRFDLQDTLLRVWEESGKTVVMVTHDVDEALYLAAVLGHPEYHRSRRHVIDFLEHHAHQSRPSALDEVLKKRQPESAAMH